MNRSIWTTMVNQWKNLSRFWSPRERRLQAKIATLHVGIGKILVDEADFPVFGQIDEDHCDVQEVRISFPDQENGYLG